MIDVELANKGLLQGYPYKDNARIDPRYLKWSCLMPDNGRHFTADEEVTVEKLNKHCEILMEKQLA